MSQAPIDWDTIRSRLEAVEKTIARWCQPAVEEKQRILEQKAAMLAREGQTPVEADSLELVEFLLANQRYAIESRWVREVCPLREYTPLPGVPPFVFGLVNIRGRILSVVDIKKFFAMPDIGLSDLNKIILVADDILEFGLLADVIVGVRRLAAHAIGPPPPGISGIPPEFVTGVTVDRLVVLDAGRILADKNIVVHQEV